MGDEPMAQDSYDQWEQNQQAQAMESDLYRAGQRAGASVAARAWPTVERVPQQVASKGMQAAVELFGKKGVARNRRYRVGWMAGYMARCAELDRGGVN